MKVLKGFPYLSYIDQGYGRQMMRLACGKLGIELRHQSITVVHRVG